MRRRDLLAPMVAFAALTSRGWAQSRARQRTVGFLSLNARPPDAALARHPLTQALAQQGYAAGTNLTVEWRFGAGQVDRLPELAADLVRSPAEVIVAVGLPAAAAAARATSERPIVVVATGDPLGVGLVPSLARPGGNVTGVSEASTELSTKRLELLRQVVPRAARVAVLWNANDQGMNLRYRAIRDAAEVMGVAVEDYALRSLGDVDAAIASMAGRPADALMLVANSFTILNRQRFLDVSAERRMPAMYEYADFVRDGGLIAYGPSFQDQLSRAVHYVVRILDGARPGDLPMEQPTRFYLTLNLRTARVLGLEVPAQVLALADEVIE